MAVTTIVVAHTIQTTPSVTAALGLVNDKLNKPSPKFSVCSIIDSPKNSNTLTLSN